MSEQRYGVGRYTLEELEINIANTKKRIEVPHKVNVVQGMLLSGLGCLDGKVGSEICQPKVG